MTKTKNRVHFYEDAEDKQGKFVEVKNIPEGGIDFDNLGGGKMPVVECDLDIKSMEFSYIKVDGVELPNVIQGFDFPICKVPFAVKDTPFVFFKTDEIEYVGTFGRQQIIYFWSVPIIDVPVKSIKGEYIIAEFSEDYDVSMIEGDAYYFIGFGSKYL